MNEIRVLVADDHEVVRVGIRTALEDVEDICVVGDAVSAKDAVEAVAQLTPDVVLMDVRFSNQEDFDGIEGCRAIVSSGEGVRVLMFSSYSERETVLAAIMAGASGYVTKSVPHIHLVDAIRRAARGELLLESRIAEPLLDQIRGISSEVESVEGGLTRREQEVLRLIAEGITNREIAARLTISEHTVRTHVGSILSKLGFSTRTEAAVYADRLRLRPPDAAKP